MSRRLRAGSSRRVRPTRRLHRHLWPRLTPARPSSPPLGAASSPADGQVSQGKARDFRPIHPPHIRPLGSGWYRASGLHAPSPTGVRLVCGSCSSGQGFAYSFLSTPPRGGSSCCSARGSRHQGPQRTFTSESLPGLLSLAGYPAPRLVKTASPGASRHAWRTKKNRAPHLAEPCPRPARGGAACQV